jgi:transposase-like protein
VIVGVRADGAKELVAIADGIRESTDDWAELLGDLRRRGMRRRWSCLGDGVVGVVAGAAGKCLRPSATSAAGCIRSPTR